MSLVGSSLSTIGRRRLSRANNLAAGLSALTLILFLCRFLTGHVTFGLAGALTAAILGAISWREMRAATLSHPWLVAGMLATLALGTHNGTEYAWRSLYYGSVGALVMLLSYHLARRRDRAALVISATALFGFYVVLFALMPFKGVNPDAFNYYFPNTSRNGIGAVLIFSQVFYSAARYMRFGRPPLVTPMVTLLLCVLLYGRSGTLISSALVVVSCLVAARSQKAVAITAFAACTAVMVIVLLPAVGIHLPRAPDQQAVPGISEWRLGIQSIRTVMIGEYLGSLSATDWLLGGSLSDAPTIAEYNLNPHNSFIRGHAYFGLPYLLLIGGMLIHAIYEGVRKQEWFLPALMIIFAGRAFFDISALFDLFDAGFFFAYFSLLRGRKGGGRHDVAHIAVWHGRSDSPQDANA